MLAPLQGCREKAHGIVTLLDASFLIFYSMLVKGVCRVVQTPPLVHTPVNFLSEAVGEPQAAAGEAPTDEQEEPPVQPPAADSCDATRHGPPVAYEDEQHRQGPGVLWRMGNLGANAASDLAITMMIC